MDSLFHTNRLYKTAQNLVKIDPRSVKMASDMEQMLCQQITRGYNIVADGWAGASNPHTHKHLECSFFHFSTRFPRTDGWTDKPMENLLYSCLPATKTVRVCMLEFWLIETLRRRFFFFQFSCHSMKG